MELLSFSEDAHVIMNLDEITNKRNKSLHIKKAPSLQNKKPNRIDCKKQTETSGDVLLASLAMKTRPISITAVTTKGKPDVRVQCELIHISNNKGRVDNTSTAVLTTLAKKDKVVVVNDFTRMEEKKLAEVTDCISNHGLKGDKSDIPETEIAGNTTTLKNSRKRTRNISQNSNASKFDSDTQPEDAINTVTKATNNKNLLQKKESIVKINKRKQLEDGRICSALVSIDTNLKLVEVKDQCTQSKESTVLKSKEQIKDVVVTASTISDIETTTSGPKITTSTDLGDDKKCFASETPTTPKRKASRSRRVMINDDHIKEITDENGKTKHHCLACNRIFGSRSQRYYHLDCRSKEVPKHKCNVCDKVLNVVLQV